MSGRLALRIDLERCTGCKSCEAACKQANGIGPGAYRNRVLWLADPELPVLDFLTVTCQQCERPACLQACPVHPKALSKDPETGVVRVDTGRCTGCGECVLACPYGAMGYDPVAHHAVKCDLCAPRRARGEGPACAAVCPTRAIRFDGRDALLAEARAEGREVRDHDAFAQGPATVYLDRRRAADGEARSSDRLGGRRVPALLGDHGARRPLDRVSPGAAYAPRPGNGAEAGPERVVPGACHICFNGCPVKYHLRGNGVLNVFGNDEDPVFQGRVCPKSQMTLQLYDNPHRLTWPMQRAGERGDGLFRRITWEQALDGIAERLLAVRERHGPEALALHAGTRTGVLNIMGFMRMFARLWGTPNVATTEPYCDASKVVALEQTLGSTNLPNVYTEDDIGAAALYVYIGDNQAETRPVNFGMVNDWRVKRGARMVVVDPRLTATASKADTWLAIRPGTDMALGLALVHHLFERGLHDEAFCARWVLGWERWRDFIRERGYTPRWASAVTDLPEAAIVGLAEDIAAADGCMLFLSRGINQHTNSAQTNRVFLFLAAITGNVGRKGGGYFNVAAEPDWRPVPLPEGREAKNLRPAVSMTPSGWLDAMRDGTPYPVRALITGNNPLGQWPDQRATREALAGLDLVVHLEVFRNATSDLADYLLPMATGIEKGGVSRLAEDRRIVWNERLIDPPGEARSDHWFWIELGRRLGYGDVLREEYAEPTVFWDEVFRKATPDLTGVTIERLRSRPWRWVRTPVAGEDEPETGTLYLEGTTAFGRPAGQRFPGPGGRLEFFSDALEARFRAVGLSALPEFYAEAEQLLDLPHLAPDPEREPVPSPFFAKPVPVAPVRIADPGGAGEGARLRSLGFDTELVTGRPPAPHFHSWTHYFWQAQEMWPDLYCQMHPERARALGIDDGDRVRIESAAGSIEARAWITPGIRPSSVFVPIGWDERQPHHPARPVNFLTARRLDPVSQQPNLKSHLCRVRAVRG